MQVATLEEEDVLEFRFQSKQEYEEEIKRILAAKGTKTKKKDNDALDEQYESLLEEYLIFCSGDNG